MDSTLLSMFDLTGKAAIVTGASRGLAKAGCDVAIAARNFDQLRQVAAELEKFGHRAVPIRADVCRPPDVERLVDQTLAAFGRLDILVNNAGISAVAAAEKMTADEWQSVIDTNLTAGFWLGENVGPLSQRKNQLSPH